MKKLTVSLIVGILIAVTGLLWLGPKLLKDIDNHTRQFYKERTAGKQPRSAVAEKVVCQINEHDCWEVVQLLKQTKTIQTPDPTEHPKEPWPHFIYTYENPALQDWGITVTNYDMYKDGGSTYHILNNEVFIYTNRKIGSPRARMGAVTVRFKKDPKSNDPDFNGPMFQYTPQGHLVK